MRTHRSVGGLDAPARWVAAAVRMVTYLPLMKEQKGADPAAPSPSSGPLRTGTPKHAPGSGVGQIPTIDHEVSVDEYVFDTHGRSCWLFEGGAVDNRGGIECNDVGHPTFSQYTPIGESEAPRDGAGALVDSFAEAQQALLAHVAAEDPGVGSERPRVRLLAPRIERDGGPVRPDHGQGVGQEGHHVLFGAIEENNPGGIAVVEAELEGPLGGISAGACGSLLDGRSDQVRIRVRHSRQHHTIPEPGDAPETAPQLVERPPVHRRIRESGPHGFCPSLENPGRQKLGHA